MRVTIWISVLVCHLACLIGALYLTITTPVTLTVQLLWTASVLKFVGEGLYKSIQSESAALPDSAAASVIENRS